MTAHAMTDTPDPFWATHWTPAPPQPITRAELVKRAREQTYQGEPLDDRRAAGCALIPPSVGISGTGRGGLRIHAGR